MRVVIPAISRAKVHPLPKRQTNVPGAPRCSHRPLTTMSPSARERGPPAARRTRSIRSLGVSGKVSISGLPFLSQGNEKCRHGVRTALLAPLGSGQVALDLLEHSMNLRGLLGREPCLHPAAH